LEHIMRAIASIYVITYVSGSYGQLSTQYDNNTRAKPEKPNPNQSKNSPL
jgi:hypothetical protein